MDASLYLSSPPHPFGFPFSDSSPPSIPTPAYPSMSLDWTRDFESQYEMFKRNGFGPPQAPQQQAPHQTPRQTPQKPYIMPDRHVQEHLRLQHHLQQQQQQQHLQYMARPPIPQPHYVHQPTPQEYTQPPPSYPPQPMPMPIPSVIPQQQQQPASTPQSQQQPKEFVQQPPPVAVAPPKRVRTQLTVQQRYEICKHAEENPEEKNGTLADRFQMKRATINRILSNRDKWTELMNTGRTVDKTRTRVGKHPVLEVALAEHFQKEHLQQRKNEKECKAERSGNNLGGMSLPRDDIIRAKAMELAKELGIVFRCGKAWLDSWKARYFSPTSLQGGLRGSSSSSVGTAIPVAVEPEHRAGASCNSLGLNGMFSCEVPTQEYFWHQQQQQQHQIQQLQQQHLQQLQQQQRHEQHQQFKQHQLATHQSLPITPSQPAPASLPPHTPAIAPPADFGPTSPLPTPSHHRPRQRHPYMPYHFPAHHPHAQLLDHLQLQSLLNHPNTPKRPPPRPRVNHRRATKATAGGPPYPPIAPAGTSATPPPKPSKSRVAPSSAVHQAAVAAAAAASTAAALAKLQQQEQRKQQQLVAAQQKLQAVEKREQAAAPKTPLLQGRKPSEPKHKPSPPSPATPKLPVKRPSPHLFDLFQPSTPPPNTSPNPFIRRPSTPSCRDVSISQSPLSGVGGVCTSTLDLLARMAGLDSLEERCMKGGRK
ncbi:hypothetical protein DFS34DRAFT_599116 [Phlyctochytrium arcticum]|nr:hypothetical protein DFS34DRAFT_599116 [Phlyctochytrium arcticum]